MKSNSIKSTPINRKELRHFQEMVYTHYRNHGRAFPWRCTFIPYEIFVSEIMLQQTQAGPRTSTKYLQFLKHFSTVHLLAEAPLYKVLRLWQGLGYNRRAKALRDSARIVVKKYKGVIPNDREELCGLPGIGPYTASAICAFAFNQPVILIETNIRAVFLHSFFASRRRLIDDRELIPLIESTLDTSNPREWYFALMDYGAALKKSHRGINQKSKHYVRQGSFKGSDREIRGSILRELSRGECTPRMIARSTQHKLQRVEKQAQALVEEGLVIQAEGRLLLAA